eukprot:CAMPEP_0204118212 /NCGR_PEP_ID=MMETSP0361-20130328/6412_1 /ASSEMBLY_ACC=CAM_ASM_000343 /TAXON_ID=268821 /ORGANISM="Scrippsiella Hangoei, Strain SHTV-5" /LENGTH=71 /DNA_ID=CAMNT_0051069195 /DNA_START=167 /DNA_END=382 /DNA_ORIENTATION=+
MTAKFSPTKAPNKPPQVKALATVNTLDEDADAMRRLMNVDKLMPLARKVFGKSSPGINQLPGPIPSENEQR